MAKLIYPRLSYRLTGLFYKVHNELGRFRTEKQYCDAFENLLGKNKLKFKKKKTSLTNFLKVK